MFDPYYLQNIRRRRLRSGHGPAGSAAVWARELGTAVSVVGWANGLGTVSSTVGWANGLGIASFQVRKLALEREVIYFKEIMDQVLAALLKCMIEYF
jgi:hypothetical protein